MIRSETQAVKSFLEQVTPDEFALENGDEED